MPSTGALIASEVICPYMSVVRGTGVFIQFNGEMDTQGRFFFTTDTTFYGVEVRFEKPTAAWMAAVDSWELLLDVSASLYGYALL